MRTEQGLHGREEVSQADVGEEHAGKGKSWDKGPEEGA